MEIKLWLVANDGGDGSAYVRLLSTKEEALEELNLESIDNIENYYDHGMIEEITLEIDENGKLTKPFAISIG